MNFDTNIDIAERDYRERTVPFSEEYRESRGWQDKSTYPREYRGARGYGDVVDEEVKVTEERVVDAPERKYRRDMGYYDDEGQYHSFREGLHRAADRVLHPFHGGHHHHHHDRERVVEEDITVEDREVRVGAPRREMDYRTSYRYDNSGSGGIMNTVTIPCHFIRIGDIIILQGRPCQVIRITTSSQTGQHRYLGVDLFTKQLNEESSFISNPSPSVTVQNMLGPVFKSYRVLDIRDDMRVVAMSESGSYLAFCTG